MNSQINVLYPLRAIVSTTGLPVASQSITVSTVAIGITTPYDQNNVGMVTFDVQDSNVRVRFDGTDPTSAVGHILYAGLAYTWRLSMFNAAKFIRHSAATGDATIFASPAQA